MNTFGRRGPCSSRNRGSVIDFISAVLATLVAVAVASCSTPGSSETVGETRQAVTTSSVRTVDSTQQFTAPGNIGTCSLIAAGVHYYVTQSIVPPSTGAFTIRSVLSNSAGSTSVPDSFRDTTDTFLFLYSGAFDPANPATNLVACDDDSGGNLLSSITRTLTQGTQYTLVITAWDVRISGTIAFDITGTNPVSAATSMATTGGTPQTTVVSTAFATPLSVIVRDQSNAPMANVSVAFSAPGSGASATLSAPSAMTNASGIASVTATANAIGGSYSVTASVNGVTPVTFSLTNTVPVATSVVVNGGTPQSAVVNQPFSTALSVTVLDQSSAPMSGVTVSFTAPFSGATATLSSATAQTDGSGVARVNATAGTMAGSYTVTASVTGVAATVSFALTNTPGAAANLVATSGDGQSTTVGVAFASPLLVTVTDSFSNPVPGVSVGFSAPGSGASATLSVPGTTDAQGHTSVTATANGTAGSYAVSATFGVLSASFGLTNVPCSFTLSASNVSVGAAGASSSGDASTGNTVDLTASHPSCAWTAAANDPWLTGVSPTGGTGNGTVAFDVGANVGPARSGTLTIGGQTFTVNQANGCVASLGSSSALSPVGGGTGSFTIMLSDAACPWTATANDAFISGVTASGVGSGTVSYTVAANPGLPRSGTITAGGMTFTIGQANGCTFLLDPTGASLAAAGASTTFSLIASDPACPWTAQASDPWITLTATSGTGGGAFGYGVAANVGPARVGSITVGGRTFSITQANGCVATLSTSDVSVAAGGETAHVQLTLSAQSCRWTALSGNSWLTANPTNGVGDADVSLTATANAGPARTAAVQIGQRTVNVNQGSGCVVTLPVAAGTATDLGGTSTFNVTTSNGCAYTGSSTDPWISEVRTTLTGIIYTVAPSSEARRTATITVTSTSTPSSATFTIVQSSGCTIALPSGGASPSASGGAATFAVTAPPACPFTAHTAATWIRSVSIAGGDVSYTVDANAGPPRSGTIDVTMDGGVIASFAVSQGSGCAVVLPTAEASVDNAGGPLSLSVQSATGCTWSASSDNPWISEVTVTPTGVALRAARNSGAARDASVRVTANETGTSSTFAVHQASGCTIDLPVRSAEVGLAGGDVAFDVVSGTGCTWSAMSNMSWVHSVAVTASGVDSAVDANGGNARTATITVRATDTGATADYLVQQAGPITMPAIVGQPQGATVFVGDPIVLVVSATGGDLHYQWRKNGQNLDGKTAIELRVPAASLDDAGSYDVVVSNVAGTVTSDAAVIVVSTVEIDGGVVAPPDAGAPDVAVVPDAANLPDAAIVPDVAARVDATHSTDATAARDSAVIAVPDASDDAEPESAMVETGGCSCMLGRARETSTGAWALALVAVGAVAGRRRRSRSAGGES